MDVDGVINEKWSIPVRDLTCFLARAFPMEVGSMVEVMVLKGEDERKRMRRSYGFIGSAECMNEIRDVGDLGSGTGAGVAPPEVWLAWPENPVEEDYSMCQWIGNQT